MIMTTIAETRIDEKQKRTEKKHSLKITI